MTSAYPIGAPDAVTLPRRVIGSRAAAQFGVAAHTPAANKRKEKTEKRMSPPRWTVHLRTARTAFPDIARRWEDGEIDGLKLCGPTSERSRLRKSPRAER